MGKLIEGMKIYYSGAGAQCVPVCFTFWEFEILMAIQLVTDQWKAKLDNNVFYVHFFALNYLINIAFKARSASSVGWICWRARQFQSF